MHILAEAFFFPLRNPSLKMYFGLSTLLLLQYGVTKLPIISLLDIVFLGYIYATQFKIIFTTGNGYVDAPDFPEFSDVWDNIFMPLLKMAGVWIIAFMPLILVAWQFDGVSDALYWALVLLALAYVPIGLMIVAMDSFEKALNPIVILQSIQKIGTMYPILVIAFLILRMILNYIDTAFSGSWIISSLLGAYGIMFTGRMIGSTFREHLADENFNDELEERVCTTEHE